MSVKALGLPTATVKARAVGVGTAADVGEVWNWAAPVMEAPADGGTMVRPGPLPFAIPAREWGSATGCVSGLTVAAWEGTDGGRADAGGSTCFVREREREEERETTLRTRSRRLPVDEDGARGRVLPVAPSDLLEAGVGVGIELSISSGAEASLRLVNEGGRFWGTRSLSCFAGTAASESRSLGKELA
ncbi:hypothetical protein BC826DRAFT_993796 [Russula brevipes]|nr:hypothetical protein BC826DRAFT_993796 [Russula brevipes]